MFYYLNEIEDLLRLLFLLTENLRGMINIGAFVLIYLNGFDLSWIEM